MTGDEAAVDDGESVEDIVDKAVERADMPPDTFRAVSVADRFRKTVRDDHAPNAALHSAIKAAAEDDGMIHSVNLMGSHAPGNREKGEPRYTVRVDIRNDGMGHPVLGATIVGQLVDRGDVRITDVVECSDDHLVVSIRPIETRVEPINVPVGDIPDRVFEDRVDRVPLCLTYECTNDATKDRRFQFDNGFTVEFLFCDECEGHIDDAITESGADE